MRIVNMATLKSYSNCTRDMPTLLSCRESHCILCTWDLMHYIELSKHV
jgi:hypothetical protein